MISVEIKKQEIFSLLTPKQVDEIHDIAEIRRFSEDEMIFDQKTESKHVYFLLEGEVALRLPSRNDMSVESFSFEIDRIKGHGVFGAGKLFGVKRNQTRARALKPSVVMIIGADDLLKISRENGSECQIMSYLAKVYFQRYIGTMKKFQRNI